MTTISEVTYREAVDAYLGWCTDCKSFTRETTEPDATDYDCPDCGQSLVMGAEIALVAGEFDIAVKTETLKS